MHNSLLRTAFVASLLTILTSSVSAQSASATGAPSAIQTLGCYSSSGDLTSFGYDTYQTSGLCQKNCAGLNKKVMAITGGSNCWCGNDLPPTSAEVSGDHCNSPCNGFDQQMCGGTGFWQIYLTGLGNPDSTVSASSGSGSSSTSNTPSVITKAGQTVVVTAPSSSGGGGGSSGSSKVGVAVGVVVGLLAVAGIIGGIVLVLKRRRRQAIEEEHRRNAAVSAFVSGKSETSSSDQRLDPSVFSHRRESIGSIADERDFSRRILQVRNPDRDSNASAMA